MFSSVEEAHATDVLVYETKFESHHKDYENNHDFNTSHENMSCMCQKSVASAQPSIHPISSSTDIPAVCVFHMLLLG